MFRKSSVEKSSQSLEVKEIQEILVDLDEEEQAMISGGDGNTLRGYIGGVTSIDNRATIGLMNRAQQAY